MTDFKLSDEEQNLVRQGLQEAMYRAERFYGTRSENAAITLALLPLEEAAAAKLQADGYALPKGIRLDADEMALWRSMRDQAENDLANKILGFDEAGTVRDLSVEKILDSAARYLQKNLENGFVPFETEGVDGDLLPEGMGFGAAGRDVAKRGARDTSGLEGGRLEPRFENIVARLFERGVCTDQLTIVENKHLTGIEKERAYRGIKIPHLDCEIVVSNKVGRALYVSKGLRENSFWVDTGLNDLRDYPGIYHIKCDGNWLDRAMDLVTQDNPPGYVTLFEESRRLSFGAGPVQAQPDLVYRIGVSMEDFALAHGGALPTTLDREPIERLPGFSWNTLYAALRVHQKSYPDSVTRFRKIHEQYQKMILATQAKGMVLTDAQKAELGGLPPRTLRQENALLAAALLYYQIGDGTEKGVLPTTQNFQAFGFGNKTFAQMDEALRAQQGWLKRPGLSGLADLYRLYNVCDENGAPNEAVIREALAQIGENGAHRLQPDVTRIAPPPTVEDVPADKTIQTLSPEGLAYESKVLEAALRFYNSRGRAYLPVSQDITAQGMGGKTFRQLNALARRAGGKFEREGVRGLTELYEIYGLREPNGMDRHDVIKPAIQQLKDTGGHGLVPLSASATQTPPARPSGSGPAGTDAKPGEGATTLAT